MAIITIMTFIVITVIAHTLVYHSVPLRIMIITVEITMMHLVYSLFN